MLDFIGRLLSSDTLSPHGYCLTWRPELIWTHVVSDALIGTAYFSIPVVLAVLAFRRPDVGFGWVFWCFALFITACGTTHFFSIWTLWRPDYGAEALIKAATAAASVATAAALWPLLPTALALPSPKQLRAMNSDLSAMVAERDAALQAMQAAMEERERAHDMLRQAQKMEAVGQLAAGIAHDFNNLLTAVTMNLARAERGLGEEQAGARVAIANAGEGARRAAQLTSQLLSFARRQELKPEVLDLTEVARQLQPLVSGAAGGLVEIEIEADSSPVLALLDRNQLESAIINLAVNARDAMPEGGRVVIRTKVLPGDTATIEVQDEGEGMREEVRRRAVEPFYTTKPVGRGSGLGLSQVLGFVQQSQGELAIESEPGRGTLVRLTFPLVAAASAEAAG
jgi:signal transduction histidine kinase